MSRTFVIALVVVGLAACGGLCAASFRAAGRSPWRGFVLGAALGPLGLLIAIATHVVGRPSLPDDTGTFAAPRAGRPPRHEAPEGTGAFAAQPRAAGRNLAGGPAPADDFWEDVDTFTGPPLTDEMVSRAEARLGYKLPESYLRLVRRRNGGSPRRGCFPMPGAVPRTDGYIGVLAILGIGGEFGIDSEPSGSREMIDLWGYPREGVVVCQTDSFPHDALMLDYSECGPRGEPRVVYVDTEADEPLVAAVAPDFETFVRGLVDCGEAGGRA